MMRRKLLQSLLFDAVLFLALAIGAGTFTAIILFTLWGPGGLLVGG